MSALGNSLEDDIGICPEHGRPYECYSLDANKLICPSCLMFGAHKGDRVCSIEDAARDIRTQIDEAGKEGLLKAERSENVLLDIRHTKLTCEEKKQKILQEVELTFSQVMKTLKQRKEEVLTEIKEHFDNEFEQIYEQEQKWVTKQESSQELVNFARSDQDAPILLNANHILSSINSLRENQEYKRVQLINSLNTLLQTSSGSTSLKEFLQCLTNFVQKGEIINIQYKC